MTTKPMSMRNKKKLIADKLRDAFVQCATYMAGPLKRRHYHAEFGHSTSKDVGISKGTKLVARWGPAPGDGACMALTNTHLPHMGYYAEFDRCLPNGMSLHVDIRYVPRIFKVIRTDSGRSHTYDFALTFQSNRGLILQRFQHIAK